MAHLNFACRNTPHCWRWFTPTSWTSPMGRSLQLKSRFGENENKRQGRMGFIAPHASGYSQRRERHGWVSRHDKTHQKGRRIVVVLRRFSVTQKRWTWTCMFNFHDCSNRVYVGDSSIVEWQLWVPVQHNMCWHMYQCSSPTECYSNSKTTQDRRLAIVGSVYHFWLRAPRLLPVRTV